MTVVVESPVEQLAKVMDTGAYFGRTKRLWVRIPLMPLGCSISDSTAVYDLQHYQRLVALIPRLCDMGGKKSLESVKV